MEGARVGFAINQIRRAALWLIGGLAMWSALGSASALLHAQEAQWIWSSEHKKEAVPLGDAYFRKSFTLKAPTAGTLTIVADDMYELYVNGRKLGNGAQTKDLIEYDLAKFLQRGKNTVAVKVTNKTGNTAALAARVLIQQDGKWYSFSTDGTWQANLGANPMWNATAFNDARWPRAQAFGRLGETAPWDMTEGVAVEDRHKSDRFQVNNEFAVERVIDPDNTGSLVAMAFNEFGHIIAAREGGPLLLIYDSQKNKKLDTVRVYCEKVQNIQGILALNGKVFVTGDGPDGTALYRLSDADRDGSLEEVKTILKFKGEMGEHGPHGLTLGPDGLIYVVLGNHASVDAPIDPTSPYKNFYEGDLVPRYEDPGGHAVGVKAPGGTILRTDTEGSTVQTFAGGIRNIYDLFFNAEGDLFVHESDMETDEGTPWFRQTQVFHALPGADLGWRSGWSWWPDYFVDNVPAIGETGRGSPTGGVVYDHFMFPSRYHGALFLADWSEGRILAVKLKKRGASYTTQTETFLSGRPLNVTDVDVGPDGNLYFITGGRGTTGGVYRIRWQGTVPEAVTNLGEGISAAIRQPQLNSAASRQKIAGIKRTLGSKWDASVLGVVVSSTNPPHYRTRAMDLMHLYGPPPDSTLLVNLSREKSELVRGKAAEMMGMHFDEDCGRRLVELLGDVDVNVRRKTCEALLRAGQQPPVDKLLPLLATEDRALTWSARRLLETIPPDEWQEKVLNAESHRLQIQGGLALMIAAPTPENARMLIARLGKTQQSFVSDSDFVDMLRVMQVAIERSGLRPGELPDLKTQLSNEFPAGNALINRELMRLLAFLQADSILDRYLAYLDADVPNMEKIHVALHLRFIETGWTPDRKFKLLKFYEAAQKHKAGQAYAQYAQQVARDFAKNLTEEEARVVISKGAQWPNAALGALYKLPKELDDWLIHDLKEIDTAIASNSDDASVKLKIGIVAVLAQSGRNDAFAYLREIYDRDPERRTAAAMGLAQQPDGDNWPYLIKSLTILDGPVAAEVMKRLATVDQLPEDPEVFRQTILRGLELGMEGGEHSVALMEWWTGQRGNETAEGTLNQLAGWQKWYAAKYPDRPAAELPKAAEGTKWTVDELIKHLASDEGRTGSSDKGLEVFTKAQCIKCHRMGERGERLGPDLTSLNKRFMRKEILESILFPSHVISDQYASKSVVTNEGITHTGIVAPGGVGETVILQADGKKVILSNDKIAEVVPSKLSAMPDGLLNNLTLEEISHLFTFLGVLQPTNLAEKPNGQLLPIKR